MRESVGYTVTLNIVIIFIIVIFTFLSSALIYFKSNKISNVITDSIERYEGYNELSEKDILLKLSQIGYNVRSINCSSTILISKKFNTTCSLVRSKTSSSEMEINLRRQACEAMAGSDTTKMIQCYNKYKEEMAIMNNNLEYSEGQKGYCIYLCEDKDYYYYKIRTNMAINIPLINDILDIPIYSNTNRMYDFDNLIKVGEQ